MRTGLRHVIDSPTTDIKRRHAGEAAANLALLGIATIALGALALFAAPVFRGDQDSAAMARGAAHARQSDRVRDRDLVAAGLIRPGAFSESAVAWPANSGAFDADGNRVPLVFGFVEFDWDPAVPGGVAGFSPIPR